MPSSVGIAAFVVGLALVIAAIVGHHVKLISIELPELSRVQRLLVGTLGVGLTVVGFLDAREDGAGTPAVASAVASPAPTTTPTAPAVRPSTGTPANGTRPTGSSPDAAALDCVAAYPAGDVFTLDVERGLRTDRKPQAAMPRDADVVIVPRLDGTPLGAVVYRTSAGGRTFRITAVYDAACAPVSTYRNAHPDRASDVLGQYETVEFTFGATTVAVMVAYGEGEPILLMTGQLV